MEETGLDFYDILREIDKGKTKVRCVSFDGGGWGNVFLNLQSGKYFLSDNHKEFYPTPEDMLKKTWEIEPEKPEEVFVVTDSEDIWFQSGKGRFQITELRNCQSLSPNKRYRLVLVEEI